MIGVQREIDKGKDYKSKFRKLQTFKGEWAAKLWEKTEGRFCLAVVDNDDREQYKTMLWLIDAQAGRAIEKWDHEPLLEEIIAAAYGECACQPEQDACLTCQMLDNIRYDSDELPF